MLSGKEPSKDRRNLHHENIITLNRATSAVVLILTKEDVQLKENFTPIVENKIILPKRWTK
jgi:hypothetical protein